MIVENGYDIGQSVATSLEGSAKSLSGFAPMELRDDGGTVAEIQHTIAYGWLLPQ